MKQAISLRELAFVRDVLIPRAWVQGAEVDELVNLRVRIDGILDFILSWQQIPCIGISELNMKDRVRTATAAVRLYKAARMQVPTASTLSTTPSNGRTTYARAGAVNGSVGQTNGNGNGQANGARAGAAPL